MSVKGQARTGPKLAEDRILSHKSPLSNTQLAPDREVGAGSGSYLAASIFPPRASLVVVFIRVPVGLASHVGPRASEYAPNFHPRRASTGAVRTEGGPRHRQALNLVLLGAIYRCPRQRSASAHLHLSSTKLLVEASLTDDGMAPFRLQYFCRGFGSEWRLAKAWGAWQRAVVRLRHHLDGLTRKFGKLPSPRRLNASREKVRLRRFSFPRGKGCFHRNSPTTWSPPRAPKHGPSQYHYYPSLQTVGSYREFPPIQHDHRTEIVQDLTMPRQRNYGRGVGLGDSVL
jgi:hypothetical protein